MALGRKRGRSHSTRGRAFKRRRTSRGSRSYSKSRSAKGGFNKRVKRAIASFSEKHWIDGQIASTSLSHVQEYFAMYVATQSNNTRSTREGFIIDPSYLDVKLKLTPDSNIKRTKFRITVFQWAADNATITPAMLRLFKDTDADYFLNPWKTQAADKFQIISDTYHTSASWGILTGANSGTNAFVDPNKTLQSTLTAHPTLNPTYVNLKISGKVMKKIRYNVGPTVTTCRNQIYIAIMTDDQSSSCNVTGTYRAYWTDN